MEKADIVANLPTDKIHPTPEELQILNGLFKDPNTKPLIKEITDLVIVAILFVILSLPVTDQFIKRIYPFSDYSSILVRGVIFSILLWFIQYYYLAKK